MASGNVGGQAVESVNYNRPKLTVVVPSDTVASKVNLIEGNVVFVNNGDNVGLVTADRKTYSIRLHGIDAPEIKQEYGDRSRQNLAALVQGMDVAAVIIKTDAGDSYVGRIYMDGRDVGLSQIESGNAWHFVDDGDEQSPEEFSKYRQAEFEARMAKTGLWRNTQPIAPWTYRGDKAPNTTENSPPAESSEAKNAATENPESTATSGKTYILGPRGGCYYLNESGKKVYVKNKSLCVK